MKKENKEFVVTTKLDSGYDEKNMITLFYYINAPKCEFTHRHKVSLGNGITIKFPGNIESVQRA